MSATGYLQCPSFVTISWSFLWRRKSYHARRLQANATLLKTYEPIAIATLVANNYRHTARLIVTLILTKATPSARKQTWGHGWGVAESAAPCPNGSRGGHALLLGSRGDVNGLCATTGEPLRGSISFDALPPVAAKSMPQPGATFGNP